MTHHTFHCRRSIQIRSQSTLVGANVRCLIPLASNFPSRDQTGKVSPFYTKTTYYYPSPPSSPNLPQRPLSAPPATPSLAPAPAAGPAPPIRPRSPSPTPTPTPPPTMPTTVRQARFAPIPATVSRLPFDDERYVMKAYSRHVAHCDVCMAPSVLCAKGQARALDVTQYVFNKAGHAYSVVDLNDNRRVEVEIPAGCEPVRGLMKAIERGALRLKQSSARAANDEHQSTSRAKAPTSYDETYYVAPRRTAASGARSSSPSSSRSSSPPSASYYSSSRSGLRNLEDDLEPERPRRESRYVTQPHVEIIEPPMTPRAKPLSRSATVTGGSPRYALVERRPSQRQSKPTAYYNVGSRGKLPVPAKDDWF